MKPLILFITNIYSIHQEYLWNCFSKDPDIRFICLETLPFNKRLKNDVHNSHNVYPFINQSSSMTRHKLAELICEASLVFLGSCEEKRVLLLIRKSKRIVVISEAIRKNKKMSSHFHEIKYFAIRLALINRKKSIILTASSYAGYEFKKIGYSHIRKFGYFPNTTIKRDASIKKSKKQIIFVGRLLKLKHPELAIDALRYLDSIDNNYSLIIVGDGPERDRIQQIVEYFSLTHKVKICGFVSHNDVLQYMSESSVAIFPSDANEGWGAVLNEYMACGCVTFASTSAGSTDFLVNDGENGFTFSSSQSLLQKLAFFVSMKDKEIDKIRANAISTINNLWNYKVAGQRLLRFSKEIIGDRPITEYVNGPLSKDDCTRKN